MTPGRHIEHTRDFRRWLHREVGPDPDLRAVDPCTCCAGTGREFDPHKWPDDGDGRRRCAGCYGTGVN
jgi:hypothetical protein